MWLILAVYCFFAVFLMLALRILDRPYHRDSWLDSLKTLLFGALWLPLALWVLGMLGTEWLKEKTQ